MHLATLTYQVPVDLVEAVGRAVNEVLFPSVEVGANMEQDDVDRSAPRASSAVKVAATHSPSPASFSVQAKEAAEVTPPASAATNLAGRNSGNPDSAILPTPAIETPAIAARQAGISQTEDQTPEDRAATLSQSKRKPLRPFCRRPETELCGGYGKKHCGTCERAAGAQAA